MKCHVYKGSRKPDTYVFLRNRDDVSRLPAEIIAAMGTLTHVMELDLAVRQHLARVDVETLKSAIVERGFYLQLPPPLSLA